MTIKQMTGENIYHAFLSGASEVIKQKKELNRINVFPVPDGDTGSNLAYTMYTIVQQSKVQNSVKKTMESIAEAALNGARGNSGIIFAQYVNGLYMEMDDSEDITIEGFTLSANKAVDYAYKSISNPVEGTMITVIKDWANYLNQYKDKAADFAELMSGSLDAALESLRTTPEKLKVLRDAHVVDSGAKGFVHFVEGFLNFVRTREVIEFDKFEEDLSIEVEDVHLMEDLDLSNRYCTEALIQGDGLDTEEIRALLTPLGDSLIIAGNDKRVRIHMHTGEPDQMFKILRHKGKILQQKADDMQRQFDAIHNKKYDIALITDSIADLPKNLMDEYQIHMMPLNLLIEDSNYLDKTTVSATYFYQLMDEIAQYPSSAQPGIKDAENFLKFVKSHYEKIIVITVADKMSGTYNTFKRAIENLSLDSSKVALIDSKRNSGAEGLIVMKAAEMIHEGLGFEEIVAKVNDLTLKSEIYVSVTDLKYMVRSGRIGRVAGYAINALNFKPVVSIDSEGKGSIIGKSFSVESNTKKIYSLVDEIQKNDKIERYAIVHANALDRANRFKEHFIKTIGKEPEYIMEISSIVAMSAGLGTVAIALLRE